jgi:hypothetical protein
MFGLRSFSRFRPVDGRRRVSAGAADGDALLRRFKPQLRYDSQEAFFADSAAEMTRNPHNTLRARAHDDRDEGALIAAADAQPMRYAKLSLDLLAASTYANGEAVEPGDRLGILGIDYRTQYSACAPASRAAQPDLRPRGHRFGRRLWLQYWFFYFYNDYHLAADLGLHEATGRWSSCACTVTSPISRSMHSTATPRSGRGRTCSGPTAARHAAGLSGRGSHASYFEPGLTRPRPGSTSPTASAGRRTGARDRAGRIAAVDRLPGQWGDTEPAVPAWSSPSGRTGAHASGSIPISCARRRSGGPRGGPATAGRGRLAPGRSSPRGL